MSAPLLYRSGPYVLRFWRGAAGVGDASSTSAEANANLMGEWFDGDDPFARDFLLDVGELLGVDPDQGHALPTSDLVALVSEAVREGELSVRALVDGYALFRADGPKEEPVFVEAAPEKRSWVAIRLVDDQGRPVPYKRYRIETPEHSVREGMLDDQGRARVDGIEPGTCKVTFPGLDSRMWKKK